VLLNQLLVFPNLGPGSALVGPIVSLPPSTVLLPQSIVPPLFAILPPFSESKITAWSYIYKV
jgi:hypothetical protein